MIEERILLVVNPVSGMGRGKKCEKRLRELASQIIDKKIDVVLSTKTGDNSIKCLAREAGRRGYNRFLVAGGDGSCHEAANGLVFSGLPLGVIPIGTGNDFSKGLNMPQKIEKAFQLAVYGKELPVDLGEVNGRYFVNVLSFVFDAQIVRMIPELRKRLNYFPRWTLYLMALFGSLVRPMDFPRITINGEGWERMLGLVVSNGPQYGGMFKIAPKASFTDGLLNVCVIKKMNKLKLIRSLYRLLKGTHSSLPEVNMTKKAVLIISSPEDLACEVDGEIFKSRNKYTVFACSRALRVIAISQLQ
jgi:YegS/Rv2252/BmrU family lipid kinase